MKKPKFYIILSHTYVPSLTSPGKHEAVEKAEFVTRITNKMLSNSTVILDVVNKNLYKNRVKGSTYDQFMGHIIKQHPKEYLKFKQLMIDMGIWEKTKEHVSIDQDGKTIKLT